jgi:hypothetical protein
MVQLGRPIAQLATILGSLGNDLLDYITRGG